MRLGKDLTNKPIISVTDGRILGEVKDLYIDAELYNLTGLHLGTEGLLKRKSNLIERANVVVFGIDVMLTRQADVVTDDQVLADAQAWLRLDKLRGREIDTPGGTRLGKLGDVMLDEDGRITGFTLARVYVEGPLAEKGVIKRAAVIDTGRDDSPMTVDLLKLEQLYQADDQSPAAEAEPEPVVPADEAFDESAADENGAPDDEQPSDEA